VKVPKVTVRLHGTDYRKLWWHENSDSYAECCDDTQTHAFKDECMDVTADEAHERNFTERLKS